VHASRRSPPDTDTVLLTSLYWRCGGSDNPMFDTGRIYQFEAYLGALWLDVNRLNAKMVVLVDCLDDERIALYATPNVEFVKAEPYDRNHTVHCPPVSQRFLVFNEYIKSGALDKAKYVVMLDLRDSRMNYSPKLLWEARAQTDLFLQGMNGFPNAVCGGFQAGTLRAIRILLDRFEKGIVSDQCKKNDQDVLNDIYHHGGLNGLNIEMSSVVNMQKIRVFDKVTPFEHGLWWMSSQGKGRALIPEDIPVGFPKQGFVPLPSDASSASLDCLAAFEQACRRERRKIGKRLAFASLTMFLVKPPLTKSCGQDLGSAEAGELESRKKNFFFFFF